MKKQLLYLILLLPFIHFSQVQIGQDIDGEAAGDQFGGSVSLSSDGSVIAIGAIGNELGSGHVRVYQNQSGTWTQIGQDIDGDAVEDYLGWSVSLSSNGSIVAIGANYNDGNGQDSGKVRIYENLGGTWVQVGQDINGEAAFDLSGTSLSMSSDGSTVAIGAFFNDGNGSDSGHVRVYENQSGTWVQLGQDIDGEAANDQSGVAVDLSSDGSIVAIGANVNAGNGAVSGHVRLYENVGGIWTQIGQDIDGEASGDFSGSRVSLSSDGSVVAITALRNDGNGFDSGHVRVYENQSGTWVQIGQDIDGEAANDESGRSISLSSDGSIVAIGADGNDGNGNASGHVRVYENQSGIWTQIGVDIDGEAAGDLSGWAISLSSDGNVLAIGAIGNDGNGDFSGHVRIYDLNAVLSVESFNQDYFNVFVDNAEEVLTITLNSNQNLKQVNLYTIDGKYLYSEKSLELRTGNLQSGIYIVEVQTDKGKSAKKVMIQ